MGTSGSRAERGSNPDLLDDYQNFTDFSLQTSLQKVHQYPALQEYLASNTGSSCAEDLSSYYFINSPESGGTDRSVWRAVRTDVREIAKLTAEGLEKKDKRFRCLSVIQDEDPCVDPKPFGVQWDFFFRISMLGLANQIVSFSESEPGYVIPKFKHKKTWNKKEITNLFGQSGVFLRSVHEVMLQDGILLPEGWDLIMMEEDRPCLEPVVSDGHVVTVHFRYTTSSNLKLRVNLHFILVVKLPRRPQQVDIMDRLPFDHPNQERLEKAFQKCKIFAIIREDGTFQVSCFEIEDRLFLLIPVEIGMAYSLLVSLLNTAARVLYPSTDEISRRNYCQYWLNIQLLRGVFLQEWERFPRAESWMFPVGGEFSEQNGGQNCRLLSVLLLWFQAIQTKYFIHPFISMFNMLKHEKDLVDEGLFAYLAQQYCPVDGEDHRRQELNETIALLERIATRKAESAVKHRVEKHPFVKEVELTDWVYTDQQYESESSYTFLTEEAGMKVVHVVNMPRRVPEDDTDEVEDDFPSDGSLEYLE